MAFSWGLIVNGEYMSSVEMIIMYVLVLVLVYVPSLVFFVEVEDRTRTLRESLGWLPVRKMNNLIVFWGHLGLFWVYLGHF